MIYPVIIFFFYVFSKMVIHFTAAWCGPCRTMEPIIRDFAAKYVAVEFIQIDVDELEVR